MKRTARAWAVLCALILGALGADVSPFPPPAVVVYPLTTTGGTPADVGGNVAILISTKLAQLGGLTVKPYTPGTERPQFLDSALQAGADYYITGFLTPVGNDVALILQVVSTHSGSIVFSTTATVRTYGDVIAQGDVLRAAILRHAGRGFPSVEAPVAPNTPVPSAGVNLSRALGRHSRNQATPAASASPGGTAVALGSAPPATPAAGPTAASSTKPRVAAAAKPPTGLVTQVDGDGTSAQRGYAQISLAVALHNAGMAGGMLPVSAADGVKNARALCDANAGADTIFTSTLAFGTGAYGKNSVTLALVARACDGSPIANEQAVENAAAHGGVSSAIERATTSVAAAIAKLLRGAPAS